jgi:flagellar assembly protein FliH
LSSIIKSQFTNGHSQKEKAINIKKFNSAQVAQQQELTHEQFQLQTERLVEEAAAKAESMERQAKEMLAQMKSQIKKEQQQWEEEKRIITEETRRRGYEEGFLQGKQEGLAEYRSLIREARAIVDTIRQDYYSYLEASEEVILQLGVQIAQKIIGEQLTESPEKLLSLVRTAIKEVREHKEIHLFVSASSYPFVHDHKEELMMLLNGETNLFIYPDLEIADTSCIIESSFGRIDASVDSQLDEIKKRLSEMLKEDAHES